LARRKTTTTSFPLPPWVPDRIQPTVMARIVDARSCLRVRGHPPLGCEVSSCPYPSMGIVARTVSVLTRTHHCRTPLGTKDAGNLRGDCPLVEIHRKNSSQKYRSCRTYTVRTCHSPGRKSRMEQSPQGREAWMARHASLAISGTSQGPPADLPRAHERSNRPERAIYGRYSGVTRPNGGGNRS
jgi:hypothetical protein